MTSLWQLTVRQELAAAHALRHYQGKCENVHGHNYLVEMTVEGHTLSQDVELVADFSVLKKILRQATAELEHHFLNEVPPFDKINPSSENLARYVWQQASPLLRALDENLRLHSVSVSEKSAQTATYREIA